MQFNYKNLWPFSHLKKNQSFSENQIFFKRRVIDPMLIISYKPRTSFNFLAEPQIETIQVSTNADFGLLYSTNYGYLLGLVLKSSPAGEAAIIPQFVENLTSLTQGLDFKSFCSALTFEIESGQSHLREKVIRVPWVKTQHFHLQKISLSVIVLQVGGN